MKNSPSSKTPKITLRLVLIVAFITQIVGIAGLVMYISYRNGQETVNSIAHKLRSEQSALIRQYLETFIATPIQVVQSSAYLIGSTDPHLAGTASLQRYFLQLVREHDSMTSIYFGSSQGGIIGGGREGPTNDYYIYNTEGSGPGTFWKYAVDENGKAGQLLSSVPNFDARTRPWFQNAVQKGGPTWSDIYVLFTGQDMAIAASCPVYDKQGQLLGVVSSDIFLSHLNSFLKNLDVSKSGESFIVDPNGLLVATSTGEALFTDTKGDGKMERIAAVESATPIIRTAAASLVSKAGNFQSIQEEKQFEFDMEGERHFLQVVPLHDAYGINWLIVIVVPESDFMAPIRTANWYALGFVLLAALVSIGLSIIAARRINRPILQLIHSMQAFSGGGWGDADAGKTRIFEIQQLAAAFDRMRRALQETMNSLSAEIYQREQVELSLRESEDRYRTLVENIPVGVFRTSISGKFLAANPACLAMFGLQGQKDMEAVQIMDLYAHPHDRRVLLDALRANGSVRNKEFVFKGKGGGRFWGSVTARAVMEADGKFHYIDGTIEDITEKKKIQENLKYLATHDSLTGIANRALFEDRLLHAIDIANRRGGKLALLFLDLDDFKAVNDRFGHTTGDELLRLLARRLQGCVRASDTVARLGGDEFAILMENFSGSEYAQPKLEKVLQSISKPIQIHGEEIRITASIGVGIFPDDGQNIDALMQHADQAMYAVKKSGKNNYSLSSEDKTSSIIS